MLEYSDVKKYFNYETTTGKLLPRGVYKSRNKYRAMLSVDGTVLHLKTCETPEEAADVYKQAAKEWYGEYINL